MSYLKRAFQFLGYVYLLRVPLIICLILIALWLGSLQGSGAEPIVRGIFDVAAPHSQPFSIARFAIVTLAALLVGTAMGVSARLIVCNAHIRFGAAPVDLSPGLELIFRLVPLLSIGLILSTAFLRDDAPKIADLIGLLLGIASWYILTIAARDLLSRLHTRFAEKFRSGRWIPRNEPGYLERDSGTLQKRHLFATYQLVLALTAYLIYGVFSAIFPGSLAPTLSLVLAMLSLFCWGLAGMSFFLDRYRVPLLAPLAVLAFSSGQFQQGDYYYQGLSPHASVPVLTAQQLIEQHQKLDPQSPMILIATTGGGIQASGWTARVLTGLNADFPHFSRHIRLISSVSGGSVGSMYFAAAYQNGEVPSTPESITQIVDNANKSSLDQVAWGLAYPDLFFGFFPWLKGIGLASGKFPIHTTDGGFIFTDRGRQLENSWSRRLPPDQHAATLLDWRSDAAHLVRPAVIFNSTLVETGDRYLLSSTGFPTEAPETGRWEFFGLYPDSDLLIPTAARLSATFPYVTPAARMLRNDSPDAQHGTFYQPEPHAVDGGYYDNYGMVSLLDWLDNGLTTKLPTPRLNILIVEIRASPTQKPTRPGSSSFGALFQLGNPLLTMANVRDTGQLSHNTLDVDLMNRLYAKNPSVNLCEATFAFSNADNRGCPRSEPLNWHLTSDDIAALEAAWQNSRSGTQGWERVGKFLAGGTCP